MNKGFSRFYFRGIKASAEERGVFAFSVRIIYACQLKLGIPIGDEMEKEFLTDFVAVLSFFLICIYANLKV